MTRRSTKSAGERVRSPATDNGAPGFGEARPAVLTIERPAPGAAGKAPRSAPQGKGEKGKPRARKPGVADGAVSPKERARGGLNPVAGLDIALEDVETLPSTSVTATVEALTRLIEE